MIMDSYIKDYVFINNVCRCVELVFGMYCSIKFYVFVFLDLEVFLEVFEWIDI